MGRILADGADAGAVAAAVDGRGGSVCLGFGFVVGLVVCAQQVRDFGGFVGAAMAGFDGSRFCWRVRLCGVFYAGFADYAGRQGSGGRGGESGIDTAVGNLVFRRAFKCEDFGGYAAGGRRCHYGGNARAAVDGVIGRHQGGEWLIFGCVVCWAAYTLIGRAVLRGIDALTVTTATSFIGALMLSTVALWTDGIPFEAIAAMDGRGWTALVWLVIGATVLAYAWYFEGVKTLGAGSAAAYITLVPIFGVLSSAWFLGELLHISLVAGCAAAVGGMTLMRYGQKAV